MKVALLYTQYHSLVWDAISCNFADDAVYVINFSKRKLKTENIGSNVRLLEREDNVSLFFVVQCLFWVFFVFKKEFDLILPHPDHYIGNHLFFSRKRREVHLIEDGVLNYYRDKTHGHVRSRMLGRQKIARWLPVNYRVYDGHLSGISEVRGATGWFSNPGEISFPEKFACVHQIDFDVVIKHYRVVDCGLSGKVLFLDQPLEKVLSKASAADIRQKTEKYVEVCQGGKFYKLHNESDPGISGWYQKLGILPVPVEIAHLPIEEMLACARPAVIVGFFSSALLNIRLLYPDVQCIAIGYNVAEKEMSQLGELKDLFFRRNVQMI